MFLFWTVVLSVFVLQLALCFKAGKWGKLAPLLLLAAGELLCWAVYIAVQFIAAPEYADVAAYIYAIMLLIFLAGDLLAWGVYVVVKWGIGRRPQRM